MRAGAYDYLKKDPRVEPDEIQVRIERLVEARGGRAERERPDRGRSRRCAPARSPSSAGATRWPARPRSPARSRRPTRRCCCAARAARARTCSRAPSTESAARGRPARVKVNCGAIPENLLESELFGHEQGRLHRRRRDASWASSRQADGGTLFLDEIGELPRALQVKLLQVLEEKDVHRASAAAQTRTVDVRIVAATNRDLEARGRARDASARTSSTASTSSRSSCRRCASGRATSRRWSHHFLAARGRAAGQDHAARATARWRRTRCPATCASWRT